MRCGRSGRVSGSSASSEPAGDTDPVLTRTPALARPRRLRAAVLASALALMLAVGGPAAAQTAEPATSGAVDEPASQPSPEPQPEPQPEPEVTPKPDRPPYPVRAQRQLRRLHCNPGPVDGRIGERTKAAVIRFQSASGMRQSGRLNPATRKALRARGAADCLDRPVPARSGQGRRVVISQAQNFLWMIGGDGRAFHTAPVVDNPAVLSPGTWRTGSYCGRTARIWRNSDLTYTEWLYGFVRFAPCGIGFHRIPIWKSTGKQIHPDWWLGTDMDDSQGCIRLDKATMQRVWDFTGRATTTIVVLP